MTSELERPRAARAGSAAELDRVRELAREMVEPRLLDLCAARVGALLAATEWEEPAGLDERERAYLEFSEQFATSVGAVSDEQMASLLRHDPPETVYAFIGALYTLEMTERLEAVGPPPRPPAAV